MRRLKPFLALLAFAAAAGLSAAAATALVRAVEGRSAEAVEAALAGEGHSWARVVADGLQVVIEGEAPDEAGRFAALSAAGTAVDASRVIDAVRVADPDPLAPPDFAVEVLRGEGGVSVIGLVPASTDREALARALREAAGGEEVADLLQVADHPVPPGWEPALAFAVDALADLPQAKLSVGPGRVGIEALADSPEARSALEARLAREAPEGVELALAVSAPRPVISPFAVRARLSGGALAFEACAADTREAREAILSAAAAAGAAEDATCQLGLGAPSPEWGAAVARGLGALAALGGGTLTFSDADVSLVAAEGTERALFDAVAAELGAGLPGPFSLSAELPLAEGPAPAGPPTFAATLTEAGAVRLEGRVPDARIHAAARAVARARFGAGEVTAATRVAPEGLPEGWAVRVLAGVDALAHLAEGEVRVTPDLVAVTGRSGREDAGDAVARAVIAALGPDAATEIDVAYDASLDPLLGLPTPEECMARITAVTAGAKIAFDPGSATLAAEAEPVVEGIAEILRACGDLRLRVSGYTDSQGRESSNLALSQARAEAVLAALRAERVPVGGFEARGFGEANPVADNATAAGREANRRIEFALLAPPGSAGAPPSGGGAAAPEGPMAEAPERRPAPRPASLRPGPPPALGNGPAADPAE